MPRNEKSNAVPCAYAPITGLEALMTQMKDGTVLARSCTPEELRERRTRCLTQRKRAYEALGLETPPFDFSS
jgi:hypothetical protein